MSATVTPTRALERTTGGRPAPQSGSSQAVSRQKKQAIAAGPGSYLIKSAESRAVIGSKVEEGIAARNNTQTNHKNGKSCSKSV